jgi:hypothetical protein
MIVAVICWGVLRRRASTKTSCMYTTHPATNTSPCKDAPNSCHYVRRVGRTVTITCNARTGRIVMGFAALHRWGVAIEEDFGGEFQFREMLQIDWCLK